MAHDLEAPALVMVDRSWDDGIAVLTWSDGTVDELWCSSPAALDKLYLAVKVD